jgi:hypothetical protein
MSNYCSKCHGIFPDGTPMHIIIDDFYACSSCFDKIKKFKSREYTKEEASEKLLKHFWCLLEYWEDLPDKTTHERMSGMLHSILATLDGASGDMPGFKVIPITRKGDIDFHKAFGENWYPKKDVAGGLHEILYRFKPTLKNKRLRKLKKITKKTKS